MFKSVFLHEYRRNENISDSLIDHLIRNISNNVSNDVINISFNNKNDFLNKSQFQLQLAIIMMKMD